MKRRAMYTCGRNFSARNAGRNPIRRPPALGKIAAVTALLWLGGVAHGQSCAFNGTAGVVAFPAFDPSLPVSQSAFTDFKVKCTPAGFVPSWQFVGANGSAPLRMRNAAQNWFIPYSVSIARTGSSGANQIWRMSASVLGSDYVNAPAGSYSDVLSATVLP